MSFGKSAIVIFVESAWRRELRTQFFCSSPSVVSLLVGACILSLSRFCFLNLGFKKDVFDKTQEMENEGDIRLPTELRVKKFVVESQKTGCEGYISPK